MACALVAFGFLVASSTAEAIQLVGNWRFEGDLTDSSGLGNDLSIVAGGPTFSGTVPPGGFSTQSAAFDGNDQLKNTSPTGLDFTSQYTFSAWVESPTPASGKYHGIFWRGPSASVATSDIEIYTQQSNNQLTVAHNRGASSFDYVYYPAPPDDAYYHLAVTYDASGGAERVKVYYNGVQQTPANQTPDLAVPLAAAGYDVSVGKLGGTGSFHVNSYYNGLLDEVFVYDRALTTRELDRLRQFNDPYPARVGVLYTGESGYQGERPGDKLLGDGAQNAVFHGTGVSVDTVAANARFGDGSFHFNSYAASGFSTIEIPDTAELGHAFTLAAFVNPTENDVSRAFSAYDGGSLTSEDLIFDFDPSGSNTYLKGMRAYVNGVPITPTSAISFSTGEYHHVAMTYEDGLVDHLPGRRAGGPGRGRQRGHQPVRRPALRRGLVRGCQRAVRRQRRRDPGPVQGPVAGRNRPVGRLPVPDNDPRTVDWVAAAVRRTRDVRRRTSPAQLTIGVWFADYGDPIPGQCGGHANDPVCEPFRSARVHPRRAIGGHCHHRHPHRPVVAGRAGRARGRATHAMQQ